MGIPLQGYLEHSLLTATASCFTNSALMERWISSCLGTSAVVGSTGMVMKVSTLTVRFCGEDDG